MQPPHHKNSSEGLVRRLVNKTSNVQKIRKTIQKSGILTVEQGKTHARWTIGSLATAQKMLATLDCIVDGVAPSVGLGRR